jgi:hypothetical protein
MLGKRAQYSQRMWIFLNDAFLSIVAHRDDERRLLVRARFAGDITAVFPGAQVEHSPHADYPFRATLLREDVIAVVAERLRAMRYDNFKASVGDEHRHASYLDVWAAMRRHQTTA